jgi:hypothetical protein
MHSFLSFINESTSPKSHPEWEEVRLAMKLKKIPQFTRKEFAEKISSGKTVYKRKFKNIENTDAGSITSLRKARNLFKKYGKGSSEDFNSLVTAVKNRETPPIIIYREENRKYLVGGNTRAMIASALGIRHPVKYLTK